MKAENFSSYRNGIIYNYWSYYTLNDKVYDVFENILTGEISYSTNGKFNVKKTRIHSAIIKHFNLTF